MYVTMITVQSLDGKMTRGDDPDVPHWSSAEDSAHFSKTLDAASLVIMGRKTYELMSAGMRHRPGRLRVVMTGDPAKYVSHAIPGQLEFTDEQPADLLARLQKTGHGKALLTGGGHVYASFMQAGLVDELLATIEPRMFGQGTEMLANVAMDTQLQLQKITRLNDRGTLLLRYTVRHD